MLVTSLLVTKLRYKIEWKYQDINLWNELILFLLVPMAKKNEFNTHTITRVHIENLQCLNQNDSPTIKVRKKNMAERQLEPGIFLIRSQGSSEYILIKSISKTCLLFSGRCFTSRVSFGCWTPPSATWRLLPLVQLLQRLLVLHFFHGFGRPSPAWCSHLYSLRLLSFLQTNDYFEFFFSFWNKSASS